MRQFLVAWLLVVPTDFALSAIDALPSAKRESESPFADGDKLPARGEIAGPYQIDSTRTVVSFEVRSLGIFRQLGHFSHSFGRVSLHPQENDGTFDVVIDARSVEAGSDAILRTMRGAGFLNVAKFPDISYTAEHVIFASGEPVRVEGELTLLGVTHPVQLTIRDYHCSSPADSTLRRCKMDVSAMFKRSQFGMTGFAPLAGDRIRLTIHAEATQDPADN